MCKACGRTGHSSRDCQSKIEKKQNEVELSKNERAELKCFNCGEKVHDATRCGGHCSGYGMLKNNGASSVNTRDQGIHI